MIDNIILDFGDVLIDLDQGATGRALMQHGVDRLSPPLMELFVQYEKGKVDTAGLLKGLSDTFPKASREQLISAWNSILLDFPDHRLEFLENLAREKRYRLFLLSNTNALHMEQVQNQMGPERFSRFRDSFEVFYLSHEMGMRKPDREIFEFVLEENRLSPGETLFVDDLEVNTRAAADLGIQVWNLRPGKEDIVQLNSRLYP